MTNPIHPGMSDLSGTQNSLSQNAPDQTQDSALLESTKSLREARSLCLRFTDDSTREDRAKKE
jgi:hypothetical protein